MTQEFQHRRNPLFNLVTTRKISFQRPADRITDIILVAIQCLIEFAEKKGLFGSMRVKHQNRVHVTVSHAENVIGFVHDFGCKHAAALSGNVDAELAQRCDRVFAGRETFDSADARGHDLKIAPSAQRMPEQALGHRAPTNIAGANEQDFLHA